MPCPDRLSYSVDEASSLIGIGRTSLYGLISTGILPVVKIGTRTLVRHSDLEVLLNSNVSSESAA